MPTPSKIIVPQPVPRAALLGANVSVPQLRPSSPESCLVAPLASGAGVVSTAGSGGSGVGMGTQGVSTDQAFADLQFARGEAAGLRAALDRAHRTLGGVRATLSSRERELRLVKEESATRQSRVQELESSIAALQSELAASASTIDDLRVSLDFMEARRATAARRFRFFKGRYDRARYESEGLRLELESRVEELRFAREACSEAVEDARTAYQSLARLRHDSSRTLHHLRARVQDLTAALLARVPAALYQRILDRLSAYAAHFGPLPGVPADVGVGASVADEDGVEVEMEMGDDGQAVGVGASTDADMEDVDD